MSSLVNTFNVKDTFKVGDSASEKVEHFLKSFSETLSVINVEKDKDYQKRDIDLLWLFLHRGKSVKKMIEVKGDTHSTGNFAFETVSNKEKGTMGCFLYTECDYLYYVFLKTDDLYIFKMDEVQPWFKNNYHKFKEIQIKTEVRNKRGTYTTLCRLVPIKFLLKLFPSTKHISLKNWDYNKEKKPLLSQLLTYTKIEDTLDNLPQANDFNKMLNIFNYIRAKLEVTSSDIIKYMKFSKRECNFYLKALEDIKVITYEPKRESYLFKLSPYINSDLYNIEYKIIFYNSILSHPVCHWIINTYHETKKIPLKKDIIQYIIDNFKGLRLSEKTIKRRVTCLLSWCNWLINELE